MPLYAVTYDKTTTDDRALVAKLESFPEFFRPLDSFWLIQSNLSVSDLRDVLVRQFNDPQKLLVFKYVPHNEFSMGAAAWSGFDPAQEQWLMSHL